MPCFVFALPMTQKLDEIEKTLDVETSARNVVMLDPFPLFLGTHKHRVDTPYKRERDHVEIVNFASTRQTPRLQISCVDP